MYYPQTSEHANISESYVNSPVMKVILRGSVHKILVVLHWEYFLLFYFFHKQKYLLHMCLLSNIGVYNMTVLRGRGETSTSF